MKRLHVVLIVVALLGGAFVASPTAQSKFWVLVNGALNYNGPVRVGSGTASLPGLAFTTEPTSGWFRNAANDIRLAVGGTEELRAFQNGLIVRSDASINFSSNTSLSSAADTALSRAGAGQFGWTAVLFANLGTPSNGSFCYCSDCTIANPCASGGTGALAKRLNGVWVCN